MLSVVIPAYNEAATLSQMIGELSSTLDSYAREYEIIIVNDGSKDNTGEIASHLVQRYPGVKAVSYKVNRGKGYALKHGFGYTRGEQILFIDANNIPPRQIPQFIDYPNGNNPDVVIGSKYHPQSKINVCLTRRFLSKCYYLLVKVFFQMSISDSQVGLKYFRRQVLEDVLPKMHVDGYAFDIELLYMVQNLGYSITESPVDLTYTFNKNLMLRGIWRMFSDTIATSMRLKLTRNGKKA